MILYRLINLFLNIREYVTGSKLNNRAIINQYIFAFEERLYNYLYYLIMLKFNKAKREKTILKEKFKVLKRVLFK
jgi:hypothetical protein